MIYAFGDCELDLQRSELRRAGEARHVEPQVFGLLCYLLQHHERLVTKDELLDTVWGHRFVAPATLNSRLKAARQAIGDDGKLQHMIRTVRGRGFRFEASVGLREDERRAPAPPARREALEAQAEPPWLVSRDRELQRLEALLQAASTGARRLVFLAGEPGIGKTTLAEGFAARVSSDVRIARGQCVEQRGAGEAYLPVLDALGRLGRGPDGSELVHHLERFAPTWVAQMPSLVTPERVEELRRRSIGSTRDRMLREVVEALEAYTAATPLVLILEDLHWSDPSTLDFIEWIGRRPEPARLMLLGTYRPDRADEALRGVLQHLCDADRCARIDLGTWDAESVGAYVAHRFPSHRGLEEIHGLLLQKTEGHPLFVRSMLDAWVESGLLVEHDGEWTLARSIEELASTIPETLRASIHQRIDRLPAEEQEVLKAGSVAGTEFTAAEVAAGLGWAEEQVELWFARLGDRGSLVRTAGTVEWPDGTVTPRLVFSHQLYRQVLYDRVPGTRRARMHGSIGRRLELGYGDSAPERGAELALHFVQAGDADGAVHYLTHAAEQALRRSAHREAVQHLTAAIDLLRRHPGMPEEMRLELRLQRMLGPALHLTRGWKDPEAEQAYLRARELSERLQDRDELANVLYGLAYLHEIRGNYAYAHRLLDELSALPGAGPAASEEAASEQGASASAALGFEVAEVLLCSLFHQGAFEAALQHAQRRLRLDAPSRPGTSLGPPDHDVVVACSYWAGLSLWHLGRPDSAAPLVLEAIRRATEAQQMYMLGIAEYQAARLFQHRGEPDLAAVHAGRSVSLAEHQGYPYLRVVAGALLGWAEVQRGREATGLEMIRRGVDGQIAMGAALELAYSLGLYADALMRVGETAEAERRLDEAFDLVTGADRSFFWEPELHRLRGVLRRAVSSTEAEESLHRAIRTAVDLEARSLELRSAVSLARLWNADGRGEEARRLVQGVYGIFHEGFDTPDLVEARAVLEGTM